MVYIQRNLLIYEYLKSSLKEKANLEDTPNVSIWEYVKAKVFCHNKSRQKLRRLEYVTRRCVDEKLELKNLVNMDQIQLNIVLNNPKIINPPVQKPEGLEK